MVVAKMVYYQNPHKQNPPYFIYIVIIYELVIDIFSLILFYFYSVFTVTVTRNPYLRSVSGSRI